jgi:thiamine kinase-like enzyme
VTGQNAGAVCTGARPAMPAMPSRSDEVSPVPIDVAGAEVKLSVLPSLMGDPLQLELLSGGLTNRNYKVTTASGAKMVARFSPAQTALLAIDRDAEFYNSCAAADAGIAPPVLEYVPADAMLVVEWIEGRTLTSADLDDDVVLTRVAHSCRQLHGGPRFVNDFDMFAIQRRYLTIVREHGFRLPPDYLDHADQVARIEAALRATAGLTVPCHNDLLAANIMEGAGQVWFIDYEYSGNNDPCFELGNIWSEAGLDIERLEHLVTAYFGEHSTARTARARLLGLMSKYGWTLWGSIQDAVSDVDFDFWEWGMEKYARAVAEFRGPELDQLIADVYAATP